MANSVDPDQTAPIGAVCSGFTPFASTLNSPVLLGNYLQQTTSADDNFRCIFSLGALGLTGLVLMPTFGTPIWRIVQYCEAKMLHKM